MHQFFNVISIKTLNKLIIKIIELQKINKK